MTDDDRVERYMARVKQYEMTPEIAFNRIDRLIRLVDEGDMYADYDDSLSAMLDARHAARYLRAEHARLHKLAYLTIPIPKFLRRKK